MKLTDAQLLRKRSGLTPEELHRKGDLKAWRKRRRVRRLTDRRRRELGLQPGVGADDLDLGRARFYLAIERAIQRELREAQLRPLAAIGFDGRPPEVREELLVDEAKRRTWVGRNIAASPLDYLYFQSKAGIEWWEYLAGMRFAYDWHQAQGSAGLAASLEGLMLAKIAKKTRAERKAERLRPTTFPPKKAKRPKAGPSAAVDARIDAMARVGRLAKRVSNVSFYLLEQVVGEERWLKDVAARLGVSPEYVAVRFREALVEAAAYYRLSAATRRRP